MEWNCKTWSHLFRKIHLYPVNALNLLNNLTPDISNNISLSISQQKFSFFCFYLSLGNLHMVIISILFLHNYYIEIPTGRRFSILQMIPSAATVHNWFPSLFHKTCETSCVALTTDLCLLQAVSCLLMEDVYEYIFTECYQSIPKGLRVVFLTCHDIDSLEFYLTVLGPEQIATFCVSTPISVFIFNQYIFQRSFQQH